MAPPIDAEALAASVIGGDRAALAKAITLVESKRQDHRYIAAMLLTHLTRRPMATLRVGITGVPGVGKSTYIDSLGMKLIERGHRVAVLAVDPSSSRSGGSILGDKTRMERLGRSPSAFIRPSPTTGTLGGVASRTREAIIVCEAAGFDVVLVETVGVGQSETRVADMTDQFVALMLPGAGDELQGIKRGLIEIADVLIVHKADGDNLPKARQAARTYRSALRAFRNASNSADAPDVLLASALADTGVAESWDVIGQRIKRIQASGVFLERRRAQRGAWFRERLHSAIIDHFMDSPGTAEAYAELNAKVESGEVSVAEAIVGLLASRNAVYET